MATRPSPNVPPQGCGDRRGAPRAARPALPAEGDRPDRRGRRLRDRRGRPRPDDDTGGVAGGAARARPTTAAGGRGTSPGSTAGAALVPAEKARPPTAAIAATAPPHTSAQARVGTTTARTPAGMRLRIVPSRLLCVLDLDRRVRVRRWFGGSRAGRPHVGVRRPPVRHPNRLRRPLLGWDGGLWVHGRRRQ